jgi:tetratricopeptide (TPR) repeat protein
VDPVGALALFKAARQLVEKGDYAAGCPKFEASLALQASASTLINIARCHEHYGKLATAWDDYQRALVLNAETKGADRRKGLAELAQKGIDALVPRLPKLRITVSGAPAGLKVRRDGLEIPAAALGDSLPGDPGPHEIQASAPGYRMEIRKVDLMEGKTVNVEITLTPDATAKDEARPAAKGGIPAWAWITGAGGLAFAGVGAYFLADDLAAISALRSPDHCLPLKGGGYACDPHYDVAADNARKNRDLPLAIALGGVGVVAIGAAIAGIVRGATSKDKPAAASVSASPWVGPGGAGATLTGSF